LALKLVTGGLALIGIMNPSLSDIFAKIDNICIDNTPIIAQQLCEKNFANIQDAVAYLESMIDPETDTIYNAQYYGIIKSLLGTYGEKEIDKETISMETKKINDIKKQKDIGEKIRALEDAHDIWKQKSLDSNLSGEKEFCDKKYMAYDMLDLSKKLFLKELKAQWALNPQAILPGQKLTKKSDALIMDNFSQWLHDNDTLDIHYTLDDLKSKSANDMANIIKNISVDATDATIKALDTMDILTTKETQKIKDKLNIGFVSSCNKIQWYHMIKQYYTDDDVLKDTTLEEIELDISLCDSYQYIDQLEWQIKKLVIHEIGHYLYYFKDTTPNIFESICWNKKWDTEKKICDYEEFVSNYAQTNAEEDYAETFSRRAYTKINKDKKYIAYETKNTNTTSRSGNTHWVANVTGANDNAIFQKFAYFDTLVKKLSSK